MARLIQKSGYIKNGKASGYMEYVATRDGVEIIQSTEPATKKQKQFIKRLLKDFPDAKELFEYSDYLQTPNRGTASAFIRWNSSAWYFPPVTFDLRQVVYFSIPDILSSVEKRNAPLSCTRPI